MSTTSVGKSIVSTFSKYVQPTYARFPICLSHGNGSEVWDVEGKKYLDMAGGIAVNCVGHAHPHVVKAISDQSAKLMHCSNLYYFEEQGKLAARLCEHFDADGPGKVFFSNSGAEANEGLFKLARIVGSSRGAGEAAKFEIITATNSFHGRTMGGIAATGQDKIKKGFEPIMEGFKHVPFNDLDAVRRAIGPRTAALLIEGIQGEGGILPASPEYLKGLRRLCDETGVLLMVDAVQCGHFRSGRFQSYQRILENDDDENAFVPDACSMAKSLGGGFPVGAFWVREKYQDSLGPGSHGSTYGGGPLACAVANAILDLVEGEDLAANARARGDQLMRGLDEIAREHPHLATGSRGLGLMTGLVLHDSETFGSSASVAWRNSGGGGEQPVATPSIQLVAALHDLGVLTVPSGETVVRFLPPLNISESDVSECLEKLHRALRAL